MRESETNIRTRRKKMKPGLLVVSAFFSWVSRGRMLRALLRQSIMLSNLLSSALYLDPSLASVMFFLALWF